jgi:hypothetical protein
MVIDLKGVIINERLLLLQTQEATFQSIRSELSGMGTRKIKGNNRHN